MIKILDFLLISKFWKWFDNINEPWRFFLCLLLVLPPIFILNGAILATRPIQMGASLYLLYLLILVVGKNLK